MALAPVDKKTVPTKGGGTLLFMQKTPSEAAPEVSGADVWERLPKVKELTLPDLAVDSYADDYLDDVDPQWKTKEAGSIDPGSISATLAWMPGDAAQKLVIENLGGDRRWFKTEHPNGAIHMFYGYISQAGQTVPRGETMTRTIKIDLSGKPNLEETRVVATP